MSSLLCCQQIPVEPENTLLNSIQLCKIHAKDILFICQNDNCDPLLCSICLQSHKEHNWKSIDRFLDPTIQNILNEGNSKIGEMIKQSKAEVKDYFEKFKVDLIEQIKTISNEINGCYQTLEYKYRFKREPIKSINQRNIRQVIQITKTEIQFEWVKNMTRIMLEVLRQAAQSIQNILQDLQKLLSRETYWQKQSMQNEHLLPQFSEHLHPHPRQDPEYFKFDLTTRSVGITINKTKLQATYNKTYPSRPAAVLNNFISPAKKGLGFQIVRLDKRLFMFPLSLITVGVCLPMKAKARAYRKLNMESQGSFMIGSSGWSYHHSNPDFNQDNKVGWTFGEGDRIEMEVDFNVLGGRIIFKKMTSLLKDQFRMDLNLNLNQLKQIKPCISFDGDEGAIVKIYNI